MFRYESCPGSMTNMSYQCHIDIVLQMELPPRPTLFDFHGVSMSRYFTDNWDNIQNFKARPDDILIATYPKAGRVESVRVWNLWRHSYALKSIIWCWWMPWIYLFLMLRPLNSMCFKSQGPRGSLTSWTCCILGRRVRSVRHRSLFLRECPSWRSALPL